MYSQSENVANKWCAEYNKHMAYAKVMDIYAGLVANTISESVLRCLFIYYRPFAHSRGLVGVDLRCSSVDDKFAITIARGLKLSTKVNSLNLCNRPTIITEPVVGNTVGPEGAKAFGEALKGHPSLQELALGIIILSLSLMELCE
ncbi:MAG: hypothetical protein P4L69_04275 [Desulfosporosinus sp.]|nr:hypothetical protein [Desulfosporosinus sp.]